MTREQAEEKRILTDPKKLAKMAPSTPPGDSTALLEAYRKHASELTGIEDRQHKLILMILGIFSAGATLIAGHFVHIHWQVKSALTALSLPFLFASWWYIKELHDVRRVTRELLVRCEIALGFHANGHFIKDMPLYEPEEIYYGKKGRWLRNTYLSIIVTVSIVFILVVWLVG
jgi:hypothetical protein